MATAAEVRELLAVLKEAGVGHYEQHPSGRVKSITFGQSLTPTVHQPPRDREEALQALVDLSNAARAERQ